MGIGRFVKDINAKETPVMLSVFFPMEQPAGSPMMDVFSPSSERAIDEFVKMGADEENIRNLKASFQNVTEVDSKEKRPVILLSPGIGVDRDLYLFAIEKLVSDGYVVVTIGHLVDTLFTVLSDGSVYYQEERVRNLDFTDLEALSALLRSRVEDIHLAVNTLHTWNCEIFDLNNLYGIGHSLGGAAMIEAAKSDKRLKAVASMDGSLHLVDREEDISFPLLNLRQDAATYEEMKNTMKDIVAKEYAEGQRALFQLCKSRREFYKIKGADHMSFTEIPRIFSKDHEEITSIQQSISSVLLSFFNIESLQECERAEAINEYGKPVVIPKN